MAESLFYAVVLGFVLGVFYDLLRFVRLILNDKFVIDFLFWICSAFSVFSYMLIFSSGVIRSIYLIFILSGFFLVYFSLGRVTRPLQIKYAKKMRIHVKSLKKQLQNISHILYNKLKVRNMPSRLNSKGDNNGKGKR